MTEQKTKPNKKPKGDVNKYQRATFSLSVVVRFSPEEIQFTFEDVPGELFNLIPLKAVLGFTRPPRQWYKDKEFKYRGKIIVLSFYHNEGRQ